MRANQVHTLRVPPLPLQPPRTVPLIFPRPKGTMQRRAPHQQAGDAIEGEHPRNPITIPPRYKIASRSFLICRIDLRHSWNTVLRYRQQLACLKGTGRLDYHALITGSITNTAMRSGSRLGCRVIPDNLTLEGGSRQPPPGTREPARAVRLLRRPPQRPNSREVGAFYCFLQPCLSFTITAAYTGDDSSPTHEAGRILLLVASPACD
jgi:hypothetical protein